MGFGVNLKGDGQEDFGHFRVLEEVEPACPRDPPPPADTELLY